MYVTYIVQVSEKVGKGRLCLGTLWHPWYLCLSENQVYEVIGVLHEFSTDSRLSMPDEEDKQIKGKDSYGPG